MPPGDKSTAVQTSVWGLEYSIHACPGKHRAEALALFPDVPVDRLLIVPTAQASAGHMRLPRDPASAWGMLILAP